MLKEIILAMGLLGGGAAKVVDVEQFRNMSVEQIADGFGKRCLPKIIQLVRTSGRGDLESSCSLCNPWSYSVLLYVGGGLKMTN